jgi:hypothetical protein
MEDYMKYDGRVPEPPYETPSTDDFMAAHIESLTAERDRLAAENAELRAERDIAIKCYGEYKARIRERSKIVDAQRAAANATLDKLREVVPKGTRWCSDCEKMTLPDADDPDFCAECEGEDVWIRGVLVDIHDVLYPKETTNDND